ncbi:hypothetical protein MLD38_037899 [Melastoma candidum]|uniref:Uncharacterized protein n=1 Tax=Melastoma candidum TaxID=119954 RepID=A0ACB9KZL7_9MYRT|nr:hypothetical protein MLD38_037899 [Melastoma candidum]
MATAIAMENRPKLGDIEMLDADVENVGSSIGEKERMCWGCGLRLLRPSNAHVLVYGQFARLAACRHAGTQPDIQWGSYPLVGKGDLEDFTFCSSCSKPKSPRTHHCRSCGMCILDMDHHCPFIGNCVGAANHRPFIAFLISTIVSTIYVAVMCGYVGMHTWPGLRLLNGVALRNASAIQIGLVVLLWQQLSFIYGGQTYLSSLSSNGGDGTKESDCRNILRFFGCPNAFSRYLSVLRISRKRHKR